MAILSKDMRNTLYHAFRKVMIEGLVWHIDADMRAHDVQGLSKNLILLAEKASPLGEDWEGEEVGFPTDVMEALQKGIEFLRKIDRGLAIGTLAAIRQTLHQASLNFLASEEEVEFGDVLELTEKTLFDDLADLSGQSIDPNIIRLSLIALRQGVEGHFQYQNNQETRDKKTAVLGVVDQAIDGMNPNLSQAKLLAHALDTNIDWNFFQDEAWTHDGESFHSKWSAQFIEVIKQLPPVLAAEFIISIERELENLFDDSYPLRPVLDEATKIVNQRVKDPPVTRQLMPVADFLVRDYN